MANYWRKVKISYNISNPDIKKYLPLGLITKVRKTESGFEILGNNEAIYTEDFLRKRIGRISVDGLFVYI